MTGALSLEVAAGRAWPLATTVNRCPNWAAAHIAEDRLAEYILHSNPFIRRLADVTVATRNEPPEAA